MLDYLTDEMRVKLAGRRKNGSLRSLKLKNPRFDFCSNDYLGFAKSQLLKNRIIDRLKSSDKLGSTGSRLISGNSSLYEAVEAKIASFFEVDSALIFSSGFNLNTALLASIAEKDDAIVMDEYAHASLKQGLKLSAARGYFFRHNDLAHLRRRLERICSSHKNIFVVVESLYSMDGDFADILALVELSKSFQFRLIVDEAHTVGSIGRAGKGLLFDLNLQKKVFAITITFGKAFGSHGAALLGSHELRDFAINFCHSLVYSTALPESSLMAIDEALSFFVECPQNLYKLQNNCHYVQSRLLKKSLYFSPIISVPFASTIKLKATSRELNSKGFGVQPILSPTVKQGLERLRLCIHSFNTKEQIDSLFKLLEL